MAYSQSIAAVKRVEKLLEILLAANDDEDILFATKRPSKLAYQIHEALMLCEKFEEYKKFSILKDKYRIKVKSGRVLAEKKSKETLAIRVDNKPLQRMTLDGIDDVLGLVGAATVHKASEIYFPDALLNDDDLIALYHWSKLNNYFIINHEDGGVTITKIDPGEIAWEPPSVTTI